MRMKTRTNFFTRTKYLINNIIKLLIVTIRKTKSQDEGN